MVSYSASAQSRMNAGFVQCVLPFVLFKGSDQFGFSSIDDWIDCKCNGRDLHVTVQLSSLSSHT